jgi:N-acetylneuraminic acid mutarotase
MKNIFSLIFIFLLSLNVLGTEAWNIKTPMPVARTGSAGVCIDSVVYIIGGVNSAGTALPDVIAYNINTDTWSTRASMATPRNDLFAVVANGKIYAIGGYNSWTGALNVVEEYNPLTDSWTTKSPMPTPRSLFSGAAIGSKIYVTGGWPATYSVHEMYDIGSDTWITRAPLALGKLQLNGGAAMGGKFYFVGGKNYANTAFYDTCSVYDPGTNTWSYAPNGPVARFSGGTTYLNGRIYHMGGGQGYFAIPNFDNNVYFDSATNAWHTALSCLNKRCYAVAVTGGNNKIYLVGGADSLGHMVNWNHEYTPDFGTPTGEDTTIGGDTLITTHIENSESVFLHGFPNPCSQSFTLDIGQGANNVASVDVMSISGQSMHVTYTIKANRVTINTSELSSGLYTVSVTVASKKYASVILVR